MRNYGGAKERLTKIAVLLFYNTTGIRWAKINTEKKV